MTTTLGDGTNPGNATLAPGGAATMADAFTLVTDSGTDTVTAATVTLAAGTSAGITKVEITNDAGSTVYGTVNDPATDAVSFTGLTIPVSTTSTQFKVRITPKSHANMPAVPGTSYAVTATITALTSTNAQSGSDTGSATVTIDNLSPANVTGATATGGNVQVALSWTNPTGDFSNVVILRKTATITDVPAEGSAPAVDTTVGTSTVRYISTGTSFTDTGLTNGTTYFYRIFAKDTSGNYAATGVEVSATPAPPTTTLGNGTNPGNATLAPGGAATMADAFTLVTNSGTDTVTAATVTLATGTSAGISLVEITNDAGTTVYGSVSNPASDAVSFTSMTIPVTTTATQFKVRITPKSHAAMPAPAGASYAVTATVTAFTSTNTQAGTDSGSATVTIDNLSPSNVTGVSATPGNAQVALSWTNPAGDFSNVVILRKTATVTDAPVEGSSYAVGNTIGTSTVRYILSGTSFTDTSLTNGTTYFYRIFAEDTNGNYAAPGVEVAGKPSATGGGTTSLDTDIAASADDAEQKGSTVSLTSTDLELCNDAGTLQTVGVRFLNLTIPQGATITNAYVEFWEKNGGTGTTVQATVQGELAADDNADTFTTASNNISSRPKTAASVAWTITGTSSAGTKYTTPNLSSIVQEIVNRSGWASGNAMVLIFSGSDATNNREPGSWDDSSQPPPHLHVDYTTTSTTTLADGTNPGGATLAPGATATDVNTFTLVNGSGTTPVTAVTVQLASGTAAGISLVEITSDNGATVYGSASPISDNFAIAMTTDLPVGTSPTSFKIRITPKSHAAMPGPPGASYAVTATVTAFTTTNLKAGSDSGSATVTIDNLSPSDVTGATATPGNTEVALSWTNPAGDFSNVVILRKTATIADAPAEGSAPAVDATVGTSTVRYILGGTSFTDTGLTNGTTYFYRIFAKDTNGNYAAAGVEVSATLMPTTTLGNGTNPANATLAPGGAATMADAFTLVTSSGTDTVTAATVTLATGTSAGISLVEITSDDGLTVYKSVSNPASDAVSFSAMSIPVSTTATQFKVRITPKSHANMPAPPGATYAVTATVTAFTSTNTQAGTDSGSATVTIDNLSPGNVTGAAATPGSTQVALSWTNPAGDFSNVVILRKTATIADAPAEGSAPAVDATVGTSTVRYISNGTTFTDTGLTNGTTYYYRIFAKDTNGNYAAAGVEVSAIPTTTTTLGNGTNPANATLAPGTAATEVDAFTLQTDSGTDTVTAATVTLAAGTSAGLSLVEITSDDGLTVYKSVSNPASDAVSFTAMSIPVSTTSTQFKVRITPKSHANMPAPAGASYAVTATITAFTSTKTQAGTDSASATVTIDNLSPDNVTGASATGSNTQVALTWTNPAGDFSNVVILRKTATIADAPAEGSAPAVDATVGTSTVRYISSSSPFTDTGLTNGTAYFYRIFAKDTNGNYAATGVEVSATPTAATTTLGNGTNPANATLAPGTAATEVDAFTLQTDSGTDTVTAATVTLAAGTSAGLSLVEITSDDGLTVYKSASNPATDAVSFTAMTIPVTTTSTQFKVRITPKSHANMPAPAGASYAVTATITAFTSTNAQSGSDSGSATVTIDNLSPSNITGAAATPGSTEVALSWTNPAGDFSNVVILRKTASVTDAPVEGSSPAVGNTIGTSTVRYILSGTSFTDTGLTNDTTYFYRIFAKDTNGNYAATGVEMAAKPTASGGACDTTKIVYSAATSTTYTVPAGCDTLTIKAWGAGGGGGGADVGMGGAGGGGGFASSTISVTASESLDIVIGGGGGGGVKSGSGSGGAGGGGGSPAAGGGTGAGATSQMGGGGGGGGYAAVKRGATFLVIGAGGGGGGGAGNASGDIGAAGGAGGGTNGVAGSNSGAGGGGPGTATGGGLAGTCSGCTGSAGTAGSANTGGNGGSNGGGGGGSGRFGGGGGHGDDDGAAGGGGGSGLGTTLTAGSGRNAGNNNAADDYAGNAGLGGAAPVVADGNGGAGNPGRIVLIPSGTTAATTTLGDGTNPGGAILAPGGTATDVDTFTLVNSSGTLPVPAVTVQLASGTSAGISSVEVRSNDGLTLYGSASPISDNFAIAMTTDLPVGTSPTSFKIRITPKSHAAMPAPPGASYAVTATVTAITTINTKAGADSGSAIVTIDNLSPSDVTGATVTPGSAQIALSWTNPADSDFSNVVILRHTATPDVPVEGSAPAVDSTVGASTVRYISNGTSFTDTGLTNDTTYFYRIFAKDSRGNYAATGVQVSATPCAVATDVSYVTASTPSSTSVTLTFPSAPVIILRKTSAFTVDDFPVDGTAYASTFTLGVGPNGTDVISNSASAVSSVTDNNNGSGLTAGTKYFYKVMAKGSSACYADGAAAQTELSLTPGQPNIAWSYGRTGGPVLRPGIAGEGKIYPSTNGGYIISVDTTGANTSKETWAPVASTSTGASQSFQGWMTWIPAAPDWYNRAWSSRKKITIDRTKVGAGGVTNFPVLISRTDTDLQSKAQADGDDILFTSSNGTTKLSHEIEKYVTGAGELVAWVKVPSISSAVDTDLYMYYGNPAATSQQDAVNVWASNFKAVWHLNEATGVNNADSTTNANTGTPTNGPTTTTGKINGALNFDGSNDYVSVANEANFDFERTSAFSFGFWLKPDTTTDTWQRGLISKTVAGALEPGWRLFTNRGWGPDPGKLAFELINTVTTNAIYVHTTNDTNVNDGNWHHYVVTYDGSSAASGVKLYEDGVSLTLMVRANTLSASILNDVPVSLGTEYSQEYKGDMDDVRIYNGALTAAWITTDYNNQTSPAGCSGTAGCFFSSVSAEQLTGNTVIAADQGGKVYAVDAATGAKWWTEYATGATAIQAGVAVQLSAYALPAFRTTYGDNVDIIFAASKNGVGTTNNKVYAIKATDGTLAWSFNGSVPCSGCSVGEITGMPYVDYGRNLIYVGSLAGTGGQSTVRSLWVIDNLTGSKVDCASTDCNLGDLDASPTLSYDGGTLYIGDMAGNLYALTNLSSAPSLKWTSLTDSKFALGAGNGNLKGFVWEDYSTTGRLYFTTTTGKVMCVQDNGATAALCGSWTVPTVAGASTPLLLNKLFVGSSDGKVHQINLSTGADEKQVNVDIGPPAKIVGDVSTETGNEIFVGTEDGKIYKINLNLAAGGVLPP